MDGYVWLKSGGPAMKILAYDKHILNQAFCYWIVDGIRESAWFVAETLTDKNPNWN